MLNQLHTAPETDLAVLSDEVLAEGPRSFALLMPPVSDALRQSIFSRRLLA